MISMPSFSATLFSAPGHDSASAAEDMSRFAYDEMVVVLQKSLKCISRRGAFTISLFCARLFFCPQRAAR